MPAPPTTTMYFLTRAGLDWLDDQKAYQESKTKLETKQPDDFHKRTVLKVMAVAYIKGGDCFSLSDMAFNMKAPAQEIELDQLEEQERGAIQLRLESLLSSCVAEGKLDAFENCESEEVDDS